MRMLSINASPHGYASTGCGIADEIEQRLKGDARREVEVVYRDLAAEPLPPISRQYARAITSRDADPSQFEMSEGLIRELESTDLLVINTPVHNFTVPAALKLWIDHVLRIGRTFVSTSSGKVGLLKDRPTIVIVGAGGFHHGEHAQQPDFLSPYLTYALSSIGISNVQYIRLQGLVYGPEKVNLAFEGARAQLDVHPLFLSSPAHTDVR
ncbi:NAD(P)H-dependent oxidoreductase [Caballeronia sp. LZ043]|uniref:FMN-dependent NADH-azoreductase n=1 Tax=Caballeronia sp. LZ043 TaxID=3038569 RepID=UPI00285BB030|nr:NAD(P)H-dependent oxidoreductase [Caballeronia sp. LZ043]MDR5823625.1 NAD(P)H-dependent oxidoreductase [Caballeronia sp. LZ043]